MNDDKEFLTPQITELQKRITLMKDRGEDTTAAESDLARLTNEFVRGDEEEDDQAAGPAETGRG